MSHQWNFFEYHNLYFVIVAMLASVCMAFQHRFVEDYLQELYECLSHRTTLESSSVAVHVCRFHVLKFWRERHGFQFDHKTAENEDKAEKKKKKNPLGEEKLTFMKKWIHQFVLATTFNELVHRMDEILKLAGLQYFTSELESIITHFAEPVQTSGDISTNMVLRKLPNKPFYQRSAFGQIGQIILGEIDQENLRIRNLIVNGKTKLRENDYADSNLVSYLLRHIFPYAPLLTRCVFTAHGLPIEDDTNNTCESMMKILKRDWFHDLDWSHHGIRAPRVAREHAKFIKGITTATCCFTKLFYRYAYKYEMFIRFRQAGAGFCRGKGWSIA